MPAREHCEPCLGAARSAPTQDSGMCEEDGITKHVESCPALRLPGRPMASTTRSEKDPDGHCPSHPPTTGNCFQVS